MTNINDLDSIINAIKKDDAEFFEKRKLENSNWAMQKIHYNHFTIPYLSVAIELGSKNVFEKLLLISDYKVESFNTDAIIGKALRCYYDAATNEWPKQQDIDNRFDILMTLIQKGANPYIDASEERNIFYYIVQLEQNPATQQQARALFDIMLDTPFPIPLRNVLYLIKQVKDKQFFIDEIKRQYGSLDLASLSGSLLTTAIGENNLETAKYLIEQGASINFCGLGQSSPLKIVEDKIAATNPVNKEELKALQTFKEYLVTKGAHAYSNPYFNLKLRPYIDFKEISKPNRNWVELAKNAMKKAALEENEKCLQYLGSNQNAGQSPVDFTCSNNFIELCKNFVEFFTELSNKKFFKKVEKIINAHQPQSNNNNEVSITKENLPPVLKDYVSDDEEYNSYVDFVATLFELATKDMKIGYKQTCFIPMFPPVLKTGEQQFLTKLKKINVDDTDNDALKQKLEGIAKDLKLTPKLQAILSELTNYLANPEQYQQAIIEPK